MSINLEAFSLNELMELKKQLEADIPKRREEARRKTAKELMQLASQRGFSVEELFGSIAKPAIKKPVQAKYISPDKTMTWSGRGRKPAFIVNHLQAGGSLEDLTVIG